MLPAILTPLLATLAPSLIRMVTGSDRAAQVATEVSAAVKKVTGTEPKTPEQVIQLTQQIQVDPKLRAKLEGEFRRIEQKELEAILKDREDARDRDLEIQRQQGGNERANQMIISAFVAIITIVIVLLGAYWISDQSGKNKEILGTIVGFLTGIGGMFARNIGSAFDFEFGSSRGSKNKDIKLAQMASRASKHENVPETLAGEVAHSVADAITGNAELANFRKRMVGN